jgi:pimeloyl-ACP methyl ester carboxylesterase
VIRTLIRTAIVAVVLGACTTSTSSSSPSSEAPLGDQSINWTPCSDNASDSLLCGTLEVPFDYENRETGQFTLSLVKHPATKSSKRIGSMLVNPGGPGFGGTAIAENASAYLSSRLLEVFDVVGWDPRGTGDSTPAVDCIDEYDEYFAIDPTPQNDEEKQRLIDASMRFADACEEKNSEILPYISTNNSARDMDQIRQALGEEKITYFGFSYGSELGATWATLFPNTVRAAVLDGATDPTADYVQSGLNQAEGFENEFSKFLEQCAQDTLCAFHNSGNTRQAFLNLMESVDSNPIRVSSDRAPVNQAVLQTAVAMAMYSSSMWPQLEDALAFAQAGDGEGILTLYDDYFQRGFDGNYGNELEAFLAISCLDDPGPQSVAEADSHTPKFQEVAPLLYPGFVGGYVCVFWSAQTDKRIDITGAGAGPILVIGVTGDAATPLASTRKMAASLQDGRLIVVDANRHTGYGENACVTDAADNYLISTQIDFSEKLC